MATPPDRLGLPLPWRDSADQIQELVIYHKGISVYEFLVVSLYFDRTLPNTCATFLYPASSSQCHDILGGIKQILLTDFHTCLLPIPGFSCLLSRQNSCIWRGPTARSTTVRMAVSTIYEWYRMEHSFIAHIRVSKKLFSLILWNISWYLASSRFTPPSQPMYMKRPHGGVHNCQVIYTGTFLRCF
jgi:hypothetical protein